MSRASGSVNRLVVVLIPAAIVRILFLMAPPYRDELITVRFLDTYAPWGLLFAVPSRQPHFPLYYVLMDLIPRLQPLDGRGISVLAGVGTIVLTVRLGERWADRETGFLAGALLVFAPPLVVHSAWLRMYAILTLAVVGSWVALDHAIRSDSRRAWVVWVGTAVIVLSLHPYGLVFAGAQALGVSLYRRQMWPTVAIGVASLPYVALLGAKLAASAGMLPPEADAGTANLVHLPPPPDALDLYLLPGALLAGRMYIAVQWLLAAVLPWPLVRGISSSDARWWLAWWLLVPVVVMVAISYTVQPLFQLKYLTPLAPGVAFAVAVWLRACPRRTRYALLVAFGLAQVVILGAVGDTTPDIGIRIR